MRGATDTDKRELGAMSISIHAPHARSDDSKKLVNQFIYAFQSTLLMRGATIPPATLNVIIEFQSTLLMRGATRPSA